jgi:succinate dehydrogenase hydrophobic anchor subunit
VFRRNTPRGRGEMPHRGTSPRPPAASLRLAAEGPSLDLVGGPLRGRAGCPACFSKARGSPKGAHPELAGVPAEHPPPCDWLGPPGCSAGTPRGPNERLSSAWQTASLAPSLGPRGAQEPAALGLLALLGPVLGISQERSPRRRVAQQPALLRCAFGTPRRGPRPRAIIPNCDSEKTATIMFSLRFQKKDILNFVSSAPQWSFIRAGGSFFSKNPGCAAAKGTNPPLAPEGPRHWVTQRVSALCLIPAFSVLISSLWPSVQSYRFDIFECNNFSFACTTVLLTSFWAEKSFWVGLGSTVLFAVLSIHFVEGANGTLTDHIHHEKTRALCSFLIKCVQIESLKYSYILAMLP